MANLPKPDRLTSLPDVSSFAICSSVASIASLAWPLLSPVSSATARASSVLLMVPTAIPPGTGVRRRPYGGGRTEKARNGCGMAQWPGAERTRSLRAVSFLTRTRRLAPARHGGQDDQHVALADLGLEALEDADVLVVEVDVDVAVELAAVAEDLGLGLRMLVGQRAEDLPDGGPAGRDLLL